MNETERSFRLASIFEDEIVPIEDGTMQWIPLRRRLGIHGFGTNAYRAPRAGDRVIEEHVESPGQEEMYVVVSGAVDFDIDGERVEAVAGTVVFLPLPHVRRGGVATQDETVVLAVGGWPDKPYHSLPWEPIFLAQESMRQGDWAAAAETLEREAGEHRDTAILQFRLAYCHARMGEDELALDELRRAIEINPDMRKRAAGDDALAPLLDQIVP